MSYNGSRLKAMQDRVMMDRLAEGKKLREIAPEFGCHYQTIKRRLGHYIQAMGCATKEQAVAEHTAEKIRRSLPLALQSQVDFVMGKKR